MATTITLEGAARTEFCHFRSEKFHSPCTACSGNI